MPVRNTKSRYRRIVAERSTAFVARLVRLPSVSSITFLLGLGASIWVTIGYFGLKMKENALRVAAERRKNERYVGPLIRRVNYSSLNCAQDTVSKRTFKPL